MRGETVARPFRMIRRNSAHRLGKLLVGAGSTGHFPRMVARSLFRAMAGLVFVVALFAQPRPASAHPHVFIDAGMTFLFDDTGALAAVQIIWAYDEFYSLLLIEDRGLDPDGDGVLTEKEKAALAGTDVDWAAGFPGDFTLTVGGKPVALAPGTAFTADYANGRIVTSHVRPLIDRIDPAKTGPLVAKVFDPTYFVDYEVTLPVTAKRDGCTITRTPADLDAAQALVNKLMSKTDFAMDKYPEIGEAYADTFVLSCAAPS